MCGIVGFFQKGSTKEKGMPVIREMAQSLHHRGPDDQGVWVDSSEQLFLGHRRLSILDLSENGHQPMSSPSGRFTVSYNGEIYNFPSIKDALVKKGVSFRGECDTEVLVAAIETWGLEKTLSQLIGMFAFALWDDKDKTLYLVRDRLGIKPLYFGWQGGTLLFGSELKSFRKHPDFKGDLSMFSIQQYLSFLSVPAPASIYQDVFKVPPGRFVTIHPFHGGSKEFSETTYWSARDMANRGIDHPFSGSYSDATSALEKLLLDAVHQRLISDVPLGAFLSGGIDSSLVVSLMQKISSSPVKTFAIGFDEPSYNEAPYAKQVAMYLKTEHTEEYVSPGKAMSLIPRMAEIYDEPFADSSQLPTFLVSQLARQHVTVSLSGDGGDEFFGGYNRYRRFFALQRLIQVLPSFVRKQIKSWVQPSGFLSHTPGRLARIGHFLGSAHPSELYSMMLSAWENPEECCAYTANGKIPLPDSFWDEEWNPVENMMVKDTLNYLPNDILVKVDRATMAVGLEARVPLLDHRIYEFVWRLPCEWRMKNQEGKKILKDLLYRYIPKDMVDRPKKGFGVPIDSWIRGPLRDWVESHLNPSALKKDGIFNPRPIQRRWKEHLSGRANWQASLWTILMFQEWRPNNK